MKFDKPLITGTLLKRYKRFLADVQMDCGNVVTAHTPNTGSMMGCSEPGSRVWLSDSGNTKRKYPLSWELVESQGDTLVGINTGLSNRLVREAIEQGVVRELQGYDRIRAEVRYGDENSRIDLLLEQHGTEPDCYVEVKNVTLADGSSALFPDAVSTRGTKHLRELITMVRGGYRASMCFCIQRGDVLDMRPADAVDPEYGKTLRQAQGEGVEIFAYRADVTPESIELTSAVPVVFPE
jgi:sugar fermentation stimulation protein A